MGLAPCLAALGGLRRALRHLFQSNGRVALGCADDGFNVVPRRVELLFRE